MIRGHQLHGMIICRAASNAGFYPSGNLRGSRQTLHRRITLDNSPADTPASRCCGPAAVGRPQGSGHYHRLRLRRFDLPRDGAHRQVPQSQHSGTGTQAAGSFLAPLFTRATQMPMRGFRTSLKALSLRVCFVYAVPVRRRRIRAVCFDPLDVHVVKAGYFKAVSKLTAAVD
jgi:hypothetical protein